MRASHSLLVLAIGAMVLAGCGKGASGGGGPTPTPADTGSAPAAAAEPTPEQAKALQASLPAPYNTADLVNGKQVFLQCAACHTATKGGPNMTGPNLYGIFGRKAGMAPDYSYSDDLKAAGWTWDAPHIDTWITNPRALLAGTKMSFVGLPNAKDRADVIAYLKVETSPPAP